MSFLLTCPNCGPREVGEFRYGGELLAASVATAAADGKTESHHLGTNLPGVQRERWYHRFGCRRWLLADRNVRTNEVMGTFWLEAARNESGAGDDGAAENGATENGATESELP